MYDKLVLGLALVLMSGSVWAEESAPKIIASGTDCGSNCSWSLDEHGNLNITGSGNMKNFEAGKTPWQEQMADIKNVNIGDKITNIGWRAFNGASNLSSVSIPNSVKTIGLSAFANTGLESVDIPSSVKEIGNWAFENATSLKNVHIAEDSSLTAINAYAFRNASNLTNINIPNSVTSIVGYAFSGAANLKNINIPENVTSIGDYAFANTGLESVNIPSSVETIGNYAFNNAKSLQNVYIAEDSHLNKINAGVFDGASSLSSINLPKSLTDIGTLAFYNTALNEVTIPENVISIGGQAFGSTYQLTTIHFSENAKLESIAGNAFYGSYLGGDINIPDSVTYIGGGAFYSSKSGVTSLIFSENSKLEELDKNALIIMGSLKTLVLPPNFQVAKGTELSLMGTRHIENMYMTAEQAASIEFTDKANFTPTIYQINEDGTVSIMADVSDFLGIESQSLPTVAYASFKDLITGTISEQYTYKDNKKRVWDANGNYKYYCRYQADFSSACFTPKGKYLGRYDSKGNRIYKKIYTVEEAMAVTKNGDKFHVFLTYK